MARLSQTDADWLARELQKRVPEGWHVVQRGTGVTCHDQVRLGADCHWVYVRDRHIHSGHSKLDFGGTQPERNGLPRLFNRLSPRKGRGWRQATLKDVLGEIDRLEAAEPVRWFRCVDVETGQVIAHRSALKDLPSRVSDRSAVWWSVSAHECRECSVCAGYEVCLHLIGRNFASPQRPLLSCHDQAEAEWVQQQLVDLFRCLPASVIQMTVEPGGDVPALVGWLERQGWERRSHMSWELFR